MNYTGNNRENGILGVEEVHVEYLFILCMIGVYSGYLRCISRVLRVYHVYFPYILGVIPTQIPCILLCNARDINYTKYT